MSESITFNRSEFETFLDTIEFISSSNECMSIFDGRMLQISNGCRSIFDVDFSPLIGENNMMLSQTPYRYKILSLSENEDEITLTIEENEESKQTRYIFEDGTSRIVFYKALEKIVKTTNNYDRELINQKVLNIDEDEQIGSIQIDEKSIKKIKSYAKLAESNEIKFKFEGNQVKFILSQTDSNIGTEIIALIREIDMSLYGESRYPIDPFYAKTETIQLDLCYSKDQSYIWAIFNFAIGDNYDNPSVDCKIHCFSDIKSDDDEDDDEVF